jgi:hypothetical protein
VSALFERDDHPPDRDAVRHLEGWDAHVLRWEAPDPDASRMVLLHGGAGWTGSGVRNRASGALSHDAAQPRTLWASRVRNLYRGADLDS